MRGNRTQRAAAQGGIRLPSMRWPPPWPSRNRGAWLQRRFARRWRLRRRLDGLGLGPVAPRVVVDVGAGTGLASELLYERQPWGRTARWWLLEPNREILRKVPSPLREAGHRAIADATRLPVASETADLVVSAGVLCCLTLEAMGPAASEMHRVLRAGGHALVTVPARFAPTAERVLHDAGFRPARSDRAGSALYAK